jgi:hypothetical protein
VNKTVANADPPNPMKNNEIQDLKECPSKRLRSRKQVQVRRTITPITCSKSTINVG